MTGADAPVHGEVTDEVARLGPGGAVVIEQIVSGELAAPVEYLQATDEWVVVLAGEGVVEVAGVARRLTTGEWLMLPGGTPHRLVYTAPGTVWLTVHAPAGHRA
ncbi:MAG: cupin domain-containing protein [Acidimicrobiia bacterium]